MKISSKIKILLAILTVSSSILTGCATSTTEISNDDITGKEQQTSKNIVKNTVDSTNMRVEGNSWATNILRAEKVSDFEGKPVLKVVYCFENNSEEIKSPFVTTSFKAFQNGIELDSMPISEYIDFGVGQKEVLAGGKITGVQVGFILTDESEITLFVNDFISLNNSKKAEFKISIDNLTPVRVN